MNVKIYGAGSIGNHLTHACRRMGWSVTVCDTDPAALKRMREEIYPGRYGKWDEQIKQVTSADEPTGGFDLICIGTPPEHHLPLALKALAEQPKAIQVEKPLCGPALSGLAQVVDLANEKAVKMFVGYDHVVGKGARYVDKLVAEGFLGKLETLDVEFREHWAGIFAAHPWLAGPEDTYLGYTERGGGASGEHSHALNLWQHFARVCGAGRVISVSAAIRMRKQGKAHFDDLCMLHLETESGLVGRVIQDVVTRPSRKWAKLQGDAGCIEFMIGGSPVGDLVKKISPTGQVHEETLEKTRPDDFIEELCHIRDHIEKTSLSSSIGVDRGADTMLVLAAAHKSQLEGRRVGIDYSKGYSQSALK